MRLSDFRIRTRIYVGFAAVIVLAGSVAGPAISQFRALGGNVDRLVSASENATRCIEVNRIAETLNRIASLYKTNPSPATAAEFTEFAARGAALLTEAASSATQEQRET